MRLSKDTRGSNANPDMAGSLGGEVFSRFTMTFDYAHQMLYLKPNTSLNQPFERDMSGLVLQAEGKDFHTYRVYKVLDGFPAAAIGIPPGRHPVALRRQARGRFWLRRAGRAL